MRTTSGEPAIAKGQEATIPRVRQPHLRVRGGVRGRVRGNRELDAAEAFEVVRIEA